MTVPAPNMSDVLTDHNLTELFEEAYAMEHSGTGGPWQPPRRLPVTTSTMSCRPTRLLACVIGTASCRSVRRVCRAPRMATVPLAQARRQAMVQNLRLYAALACAQRGRPPSARHPAAAPASAAPQRPPRPPLPLPLLPLLLPPTPQVRTRKVPRLDQVWCFQAAAAAAVRAALRWTAPWPPHAADGNVTPTWPHAAVYMLQHRPTLV